MESYRIDRLRSRITRQQLWRERIRREWCFVRAVFSHRGPSFLALLFLLACGAVSFQLLEPEKHLSLAQSLFFTWSLMFGQPPEALPEPLLLQFAFFVVPVLGVTIFLEAIVEISLMLRDRSKGDREWFRIMAGSMKGHIVLVGVGRLGWRIFTLLRKLGRDVVVIERDETCQFVEDVRRSGQPLFIGDARREQWLVEANVAGARSIVLASDDDLANLEIALDARRLNPKIDVVMRMFDPDMAEKVRSGFQIHTAISGSSLAAPAFATAAVERSIVNSVIVDDELVVSQRWTVAADGPLAGRSIADMLRTYSVGVVERRTKLGERSFFPAPEVVLAGGDELVVQGTFETVSAHGNLSMPR